MRSPRERVFSPVLTTLPQPMLRKCSQLHRVMSWCVTLAALAAGFTSGQAAAEESVIVVTGSGAAEVRPNLVTIEFFVVTRARSAAEASQLNASRTNSILAALRSMGIPDTATTSIGYAVQPSWDPKRGTQKERESTATHRMRVRIAEIRTVGAIVESVLDGGADRVESIAFSASSIDSVRDAALTEAVEQARRGAESMARAAGGDLGTLIEVTTQWQSAPPPTPRGLFRLELPVNLSTAAAITPGPMVITASVLGRWTFADRR
jgi:uncharacterized protein YggE